MTEEARTWAVVAETAEAAIAQYPELDLVFAPLLDLAWDMQNPPREEATHWEFEVWRSRVWETTFRLRRFAYALAEVMSRHGVPEEDLDAFLKPLPFYDFDLADIEPKPPSDFFFAVGRLSTQEPLRSSIDPVFTRLREGLREYEQDTAEPPSRGRRRRPDKAS